MDTLIQDIRDAVRSMRQRPLLATVVTVTLGLSTAAIATVFTVGYGLRFRQLSVERPEELVVVAATRDAGRRPGFVSYPDYVHFRDSIQSVKSLAAHYLSAPLFVTVGERAEQVNGGVVTASYFGILGVRPRLGRLFTEEEDRVVGRDQIAVVSYEFWRNWFGGSPDALNAIIRINGAPFTIVGVAPPWLRNQGMPVEIYIPSMMLGVGYRFCRDPVADNGCTILEMLGRIADGRTVSEVRAEVETLIPAHWSPSSRDENSAVTAFRPGEGPEYDDSEARLLNLLAGVAALLMLVCCANLTGLLISRNTTRVREFAIRMAIGAGRARLVRQFLTESLLLAVVGGLVGLLVSRVLTGILKSMFYTSDYSGRPLYFDFSPAAPVIAAVLGLTIVTAFLFGTVPALSAVYAARNDSLARQVSPAYTRSAFGRWLIGLQAAIAVALVAVAALLLSSARTLFTDAAYDPTHVAVMRLRPLLMGYTAERGQQFHRDVLQRLHTLAGVESASVTGTGGVLGNFEIEVSLPGWPDGQTFTSIYHEIGTRYFDTLRLPLIRGRDFAPSDRGQSARVAIVNETLARRLWPNSSVVGESVRIRDTMHQVVGVVRDVSAPARSTQTPPYVYVPYWQNPRQVDARYVVRVQGDPAKMLPALVREVGRVDPDVPVSETVTLSKQLLAFASELRLSVTVLVYAAGIALILTAIGLYSSLASSVSRRTKEIGIRMALGADVGRVRRLVFRQGMAVIGLGAAGGLLLAAGSTRLIAHLLYGPPVGDLPLYAAAAALVVGVGLLACWLPAQRAVRVDPMVALRQD